jgi:hypothetical protein
VRIQSVRDLVGFDKGPLDLFSRLERLDVNPIRVRNCPIITMRPRSVTSGSATSESATHSKGRF